MYILEIVCAYVDNLPFSERQETTFKWEIVTYNQHTYVHACVVQAHNRTVIVFKPPGQFVVKSTPPKSWSAARQEPNAASQDGGIHKLSDIASAHSRDHDRSNAAFAFCGG